MSDQHAADTAPFDMPPVSAGFDARGGWPMIARLAAFLVVAALLSGCAIGCLERTPDGRGITACGGLS